MRVLLSVLFALGLAVPAAAFSDADRSAIESVIEQQLQAFLRDDAAAAYEKAAKAKPADAMEALDAAYAREQIE